MKLSNYYIFGSVVICAIIVIVLFLVYILKSEHRNYQLKGYNKATKYNNFEVLFNEKTKKVSLCFDKIGSSDEFYIDNLFDKNERIIFLKYIYDTLRGNNPSECFIRFNKVDALFKVIYKEYKNHIFYLELTKAEEDENVNDHFPVYSDLKKFYSKLKRKRFGTCYVIKFNTLNVILRRYNETIASMYLNKIKSLLNRHINISTHKSMLCLYENDTFIYYKNGFYSLIKVRRFVKKTIEQMTTLLDLDSYQFYLHPTIGVYCSYNKSFEQIISNALYASTVKSLKPYHIFDEKDEKNLQLVKDKRFEINKFIKEIPQRTSFIEVVSYAGGDAVGHIPYIDVRNSPYQSFKEIYNFNDDQYYKKEISNKRIQSWLNLYKERHHEKIFLFMLFEYLDDVIKISQDEKFKNIDICVVIMDYEALFDNVDYKRQLFKKAIECNISLGVRASEKMLTNLSGLLYMFGWVFLPTHMSNSVSNERYKIQIESIIQSLEKYNLNVAACNVTEYANAEILKNIGVDYVSGDLLDKVDEYSSVREISKLLDERVE